MAAYALVAASLTCHPGAVRLLIPLLSLVLVAVACDTSGPLPLPDDPRPYLDDVEFRRMVLERDLVSTDNVYAQRRLAEYAIAGEGWEMLPERDRPSRPLTDEDRARLAAGEPLLWDPAEATTLMPDVLPEDFAGWERLGQRVIAEYPISAEPLYEALAALPGGLEEAGFLRRPDDAWVGLRVFQDEDGEVQIGNTCGQCHCSLGEADVPLPVLANKRMDVGRAELIVLGYDPDAPPPPNLPPRVEGLFELGPGRVDVLADGVVNPFAIPDLGGLGRQPYLQQNANWRNTEPATLAIRCETLFITSNGQRTRIPRELAWALTAWILANDSPMPLDDDPGPDAETGAVVFEEAGCADCHPAPDYTSDRLVTIEEVGTDSSAPGSPIRRTGFVRIPSLRGVGRTGPWLHHGAVHELSELFDPDRSEPGHPWGQELDEADRESLVAFLLSI